ncbi:hypothetical protein Pmani_033810 [Petrolisthes manimaculis]|uniref:Uncharacterized protein n=1 Tax=Petrolisthes manimaculis TaxID=1843537 RepID=A0AAE1NQB9_9EUCA|nr:hypothetical protein Pmani_033810 [Petrolisthes manimaculis]
MIAVHTQPQPQPACSNNPITPTKESRKGQNSVKMKMMMNMVLTVMMVMLVVAHAALLPGGSGLPHKVVVGGEGGPQYIHHLNSDLVTLLQRSLPEVHDIRIVEGPNGPRLDMPLSGCKDSLECHHRFTNYLGLLVRMMETGKK